MSATRMPALKLLFALARYAGLGIPSELPRATLVEVDFQGGRLRVPSPRTERRGQRLVPIAPKLTALLQDRFAEVEEGPWHLVTIRDKGAALEI